MVDEVMASMCVIFASNILYKTLIYLFQTHQWYRFSSKKISYQNEKSLAINNSFLPKFMGKIVTYLYSCQQG